MLRWWLVALCVVVPAVGAENLLRNGSFEQVSDRGTPIGWDWSPGRAQATLRSEAGGHTGRRCLLLVNTTPREPHVFSHLAQTVRVEPNTTYTLSCYTRGAAGFGWLGGGPDWAVRAGFTTGDDWHRTQVTFETGPDERSWLVMLLIEDVSDGLQLDSVQLEEGAVASDFAERTPPAPGQIEVRLVAAPETRNLLPNPSFETLEGAAPAGWVWDPRNTDATLTVIEEGHFGRRALRFANSTPFGAHVYGQLRLPAELPVAPDSDYTLSFHVRSEKPGPAWVGGAAGWIVRVPVPATHGAWRRVSRTFRTGANETMIPLMINTDGPGSFDIDDVQLEPGRVASPFGTAGLDLPPRVALGLAESTGDTTARWKPDVYPLETWAFAADELRLEAALSLPRPVPGGWVAIECAGQTGELRPADGLPAGGTVLLSLGLGHDAPEQTAATVIAHGPGGELARASQTVRVVTLAQVERLLSAAEALLPALDEKAAGDDYAAVTAITVREFIGFAREDLAGGEIARAYDTAVQLGELGRRRLAAPPRGRTPRFVTSRIEPAGPAFLGDVRLPDGTVERRPVYFTGYGHFGAVRRDLEKFPAYGCNLIQVEFGPNSIFPEEGPPRAGAVDEFLKLADRAAASGVMIDLLLSPHYVPGWLLEKHPTLRGLNGGFLQYDFYAPEARALEEAFLRYVIPRIQDHPALHSLCLSNEPLCIDARASASYLAGWREWLKARYGDIGALNRAWGAAEPNFEAIVVPEPTFEASARGCDILRYNQEAFAGWHAWMAGIIRDLAPGVPLHAKIMIGAHFGLSQHGMWCIAPELFGELSDLNGNDCWKPPHPGELWACGWQAENMGYDYQRSAADKPIFNSENHLIQDRDLTDVSPEYIRNVYWQGAIHGQGAETTWVWERTFDPRSDFAGSIMHRPECVVAKGETGLDLMVAAREVAAIAGQPAPLAIYWSQTAAVFGGNEYERAVRALYQAANFADLPLGFVNDRDCERYAGGGPSRALEAARLLVVPPSARLPKSAAGALARFVAAGGRIVYLGEPPALDEAGQPLDPLPEGSRQPAELSAGEPDVLWQWTRRAIAEAGLAPVVPIGAWGVEARSAAFGGGRIVNLCNYLTMPVTVALPDGAVDGLTGERLGATVELPPLAPRLVRVGP